VVRNTNDFKVEILVADLDEEYQGELKELENYPLFEEDRA